MIQRFSHPSPGHFPLQWQIKLSFSTTKADDTVNPMSCVDLTFNFLMQSFAVFKDWWHCGSPVRCQFSPVTFRCNDRWHWGFHALYRSHLWLSAAITEDTVDPLSFSPSNICCNCRWHWRSPVICHLKLSTAKTDDTVDPVSCIVLTCIYPLQLRIT